MEMHQITCDNLGMTRDTSISALSKDNSGATNYAFENHNIRVLAVDDNTKFTVTNEKSTKYEGVIKGRFLGGGTVGRYLVVFIQDSVLIGNTKPDHIYRLEYMDASLPLHPEPYVDVKEFYNGNLNFKLDAPIETLGFYESDEIQKMYWVDGVNPNRFINISDKSYAERAKFNNYSFDFQGFVSAIPQVTITKDYSKSGYFQSGTMQYFITYFNKYGIETGIVYNSDLQYISIMDRGGKADEAVSCAFDIEIKNIDTNYEYLRIYACYRSGLNGVVSSKIIADLSLKDKVATDTLVYTDSGVTGSNFNSEDMPYIGGQDIRANTLDYKQDTLFLGDIKLPNTFGSIDFTPYMYDVIIKEGSADTGDLEQFTIKEGRMRYTHFGVTTDEPFIDWVYKWVSPIATEGLYQYDSEMQNSQEDIAGFKWREVYRFGIQFLSNRGEWTSAMWLGDKYCNYKPMTFYESVLQGAITEDENASGSPTVDQFGAIIVKVDDPDGDSYREVKVENSDGTESLVRVATFDYKVQYTNEGCYIPQAVVNINAIKNCIGKKLSSDFIAYRLLVADTNMTNRRILEQGVLNPTMFCYADRYFNRPFSIPSWLFRPRAAIDEVNKGKAIVNHHYETLPIQTAHNAELQGVIKKQVPGYTGNKGKHYNSMMFIYAANAGSIWSGFEQWKLIYYDSGGSDMEQAERLYLSMYQYPNLKTRTEKPTECAAEYARVAKLIIKYGIPLQKGIIKNSGNDDEKGTSAQNYPGVDIVPYKDIKGDTNAIIRYLSLGYLPIQIYGKNYKIISSRWEDYNHKKDKQGTLSKWSTLRGWLVDEITEDMVATTKADVGDELAGKIVLSPAMLPSSGQIKSIARAGSSAAEIALAIAAALCAAAAVVISCLSFGTLAAPMAALTAFAIGAATSALAGAAVGAASAAAVLDLEREDMSEICKEMLAMGYLPAGSPGTGLSNRKHRSRDIGQVLEKFFTPSGYESNSGLAGFNSWKVPVMIGEPEKTGKPFKTGHPYTSYGHIGEDYNAFIMTGKLSGVDREQADLKKKQNLFCVDESIVTLNAPDIEDNVYSLTESHNLRLDIIGMIPIEATYGIYDMSTSNGLNSNSQVLRGKFKTKTLDGDSDNSIGMLNGDIYQDFHAEESIFTTSSPQVTANETVETYRVFMWNRNSAGFWFPNVTTKDGTGSIVTSPRSVIQRKIFANMRYSTNTDYYKPFKMNIESPIVCLDAQSMLKTISYGNDKKNYYENVDTLSINSSKYGLVIHDLTYPQKDASVVNGGITDPVSIRYRQTPHVIVPLEWNKYQNAASILPCLATEDPLNPSDLYPATELENVKLYGTRDAIPIQAEYYYMEVNNVAEVLTDSWNKEGDLDAIDLVKLSELLYQNHKDIPEDLRPNDELPTLRKAINDLKANLSSRGITKTDADILSQAYTKKNKTSGTKLGDTLIQLFLKNKGPKAPEYASENTGNAIQDAVNKVANEAKRKAYQAERKSHNYYIPFIFHVAKDSYYNVSCQFTRNSDGTYSDIAWESHKITTLPTNSKVHTFSAGKIDSLLYTPFDYSVWQDSSTNTTCFSIYPKLPEKDVASEASKQNWFVFNHDSVETNYFATKDSMVGNATSIVIYDDFSKNLSVKQLEGTWYQRSLSNWENVRLGVPYLFMGELIRKEFDYDSWNGGTSEYALQQLVWNVASKVTPIKENVLKTWGDTFYQRWDCEKTYPFTEEDTNSNVEILSFMLESHANLDGRCDVNRGIHNLLNVRPSNTMYNNVYSQKDNFFTYQVLDEKFAKTHFESDIVWSLTKNNMDDTDKWTCLLATNEMSLDGRYGTVRKILNVNDVLVAFQDTGLANIRYNETAALNTTSGLPLQMGNTGKVEGYRMISDTIGCHNKFSISKNSAGVFFADDFGKSFNQFTTNGGVADIGVRANFSIWFKKHLNGKIWNPKDKDNFRTSYDEVTHDLYIIKNDTCVIYNTLLQKFTSFMDYVDTPMITRLISAKGKSDSFAIHNTVNKSVQKIVEIWKMFAGASLNTVYGSQGAYGYIYGAFRPYSMEYRLNPDPMHDSIFTNYQFAADWTDPSKEVDEENIFDTSARRYTTFDTVEAKNEYQQGIMSVLPRVNGYNRAMGRQPLKSMFRLWRGDIPRNGDTLSGHTPLSDRMRNPWIHLKFTKTTADDSKMTFHNLMVNYYNQYGRF